MEWENVLKRDDIIGGELETVESGGIVFRGPITMVEFKDGTLSFSSPWVAVKCGPDQWQRWHTTDFSFNVKVSPPWETLNGCIEFSVPYVASGTIFPKGHQSKLDSAKVAGLDLTPTQ